jgi:hypothetical protein
MIRHFSLCLCVFVLLSLSWSAHAANDGLADLRQMYDGTMLPGVEVATFSNSDKLQPVRVVRRGKSSQPFNLTFKDVTSICTTIWPTIGLRGFSC